MDKIACVKHRDGWCACRGSSTKYRDQVRTLCNHCVIFPFGLKYGKPTCKQCLAIINSQTEN